MNPKSIAPFIGFSASVITAACLGAKLPPASIAPPLDNDTNSPMLAKNATGVLGTIERLDPAIDKLLPPDAKVEILVEGVDWAEGPIWFAGGLNFSDVKQKNGLTLDRQGRLVMCQHGDRRVPTAQRFSSMMQYDASGRFAAFQFAHL